MIVIRFGKWRSKATRMFIYKRLYFDGIDAGWTPFCIKTFRYIG